MTTELEVTLGGYSTAGRKPVNQDAFAAHQPPQPLRRTKGVAAAIADGVSASRDAHLASQTSVTTFLEDYFCTPDSWSVRRSAARVLSALNRWLHQQGNRSGGADNTQVTTFAALILKSTTAHLLHVGDSRIYRLRAGQLEQLTRDHSSRYGGSKRYLTRALGVEAHTEVDYRQEPAEAGDLYLLSTDGVHEFMRPAQLASLLEEAGPDLEATARQLTETALAAGSDDNLSCLLLRVTALPEEALDEAHRKLTALPLPPALQPGNQIDGYEVLEILHASTRSHLYLVRDGAGGQLYTLKTPSLNAADDPLYLDGFIKEEWVGRRVQHPGVMRTFLPPRPKQFLYYLAEYLPYPSLRQWQAENPAPTVQQVRALIRQTALALRALQRLEMIHQDLKPENLLLDPQGRIKLIDFGTVRIAGEDEISSPLDRDIPQGSVNYVAPEYLLGEPGSHRSDLFSLGVIAYELLTGQLPYRERQSRDYRLRRYTELRYIPARSHRPDLPAWVDGALARACQANPTRRYAALSEFLHDLEHPNPAFTQSARQQPLLERNPLLFWKGLSLLLALLLILQGAWLAGS